VTTAATGTTSGDGVNFGYDDASGAYVWNREASPLIFSTSNTERVRVDAAGNVGIGAKTFSPWSSDFKVLGLNTGGGFTIAAANTSAGALHITDRAYFNGSAWVYSESSAPVSNYYQNVGIHAFRVAPGGTAGSTFTWTTALFINNAGNVGVGTGAPTARLHVAGDIRVDGNINAKYQDVAEWVPSTQRLQAGTVVVLDPERPNHVLASTTSYDTAVAGVISEKPGLSLGEEGEGKALVATTGRVKVRVDATKGAVKIGDLLVTGEAAGVAMKSQPMEFGGRRIHAPGTIIGKALEPLAGGVGEILVLLSLQ
jgi:hypothetical protein